jgi:hypothetical protein
MEIRRMQRTVILTALALMATATAPGQEAFAGSRPGADDHPLTLTATLILLDVSKIDGAEQSFTADVFLKLQWRDERLAMETNGVRRLPLDSIWNPRIQIINQRRAVKTFDDIVDVMPDGTVVSRQRYDGEFSTRLDFHDFPLDHHRFSLQLVVPGYGPDEIDFVPATEGEGIGHTPELTISDWTIGAFELRTKPFQLVTGGREVAGLEGEFEARRHRGFFFGKAFISVAIIVFMSWVVFWIGTEHIGPRLSVAVTSMLTLVAYRFLLGQSLPPVSYLTRLDHYLLGATVLVFLALIQVTMTGAMTDEHNQRRATRINRISRWAFPAAFALLSVLSFWV